MDTYGRSAFSRRESIILTRDKEEQINIMLISPSYSDPRFDGPNSGAQTIFLASELEITDREHGTESVKGLFYVYDDRLVGYHGHEKVSAAREEAKEKVGNCFSAKFFEQMLRNLENDETIKLGHILTGVNVSTLYPYRVFGYSTDK